MVTKRSLTQALLTMFIFAVFLLLMFGLTTEIGRFVLAIVTLLAFVVLCFGVAYEVAKILTED